MFNYQINSDAIRAYIVLFGSLFSRVTLTREGDPFIVPISFSPKDKMIQRILTDPDIDKTVALTLPRLGYDLIDITINNSLRLQHRNIYCDKDGNRYQAPTPVTLTFMLYLLTKNAVDANYVTQQILPFFLPTLSTRVTIGPIRYTVPITLQKVSRQDDFEGPVAERRYIEWNFTFEVNAWLPGALIGDATSYITQIEVDAVVEKPRGRTMITIRPGLTSDGQPTSNASASIDRNDIKPEDNYGYIVEVRDE